MTGLGGQVNVTWHSLMNRLAAASYIQLSYFGSEAAITAKTVCSEWSSAIHSLIYINLLTCGVCTHTLSILHMSGVQCVTVLSTPAVDSVVVLLASLQLSTPALLPVTAALKSLSTVRAGNL